VEIKGRKGREERERMEVKGGRKGEREWVPAHPQKFSLGGD